MKQAADIAVGVIGCIITILINVDCLMTTMSVSSDGFFSHTLALFFQFVAKVISPRCYHTNRKILMLIGGLTLVCNVLMWYFVLWGGWTMIFFFGRTAVVTGEDNHPANIIERIYFAGMCISTLGVGDVLAGKGGFQFLSALAALNGFFLVGVSSSYIFSIVSAVADKRLIASAIGMIGGTPQGILISSFNGSDFSDLEPFLQSLTNQLISRTHKTILYPIMQNYFGSKPRHNDDIRAAALYEAVLLLKYGVADESCKPNKLTLLSIEKALAFMVKITKQTSIWNRIGKANPAHISKEIYNSVIDKGICMKPYDDYVQLIDGREEVVEIRKSFHLIIRRNRWQWREVYECKESYLLESCSSGS